ncbi:Helicase, C-terminal,Helicase superfamily 1/2, ATP-binding domain,P-loop containing nucleoside [Cinara cedri]|uniref:RNA helicase n=1 Tax=Cinara cedri TaxID=506608 RepID=A0A5E4NHN8_9HEMI|nr:Helicase, C-terminal,Helicase superfamily 1/2, ATP-binding domain,P-loop containing nucleoside [Cinara cedri]
MDSEINKNVQKQSQLSEQIEKLLAEKKILEDKISVLNECLSLEKVQKKIFQLENKQKILTTLESMVNSLKVEIKPLDYLKQLLSRELMVSTLPSNDCNIEEQTIIKSPVSTANSECAIETLDSSLSNVSSEESVMVLSEYDVLSDEEHSNNDMEETVENKVIYDEALQMASSVHLPVKTSTIDIESILPPFHQTNEVNFVQSTSKDMATLMNSNSKSKELLEMYITVNKEDFQNYEENKENELDCNNGKIESTIQQTDQLSIFDKEPLDIKEYNNFSKSINVSWVKIDTNESFECPMENETQVQDNLIPKVNRDVEYSVHNVQLCSQQSESKDMFEIKNIENVNNFENKTHNLFNLNNATEEKFEIISLLPDTKNSCALKECDQKQGKLDVEVHMQNYQSCSYQSGSKNNSNINLKNVCNKLEYNYTNINPNNSICSTDILKNTNDNDLSTCIKNNEKSIQPCGVGEFNIRDLNAELWNGIHHAGFQNLMTSQLECISHFINGCNVFLHSYPCVGKSTICFISVLQKIDTTLNVCQAIILVPTLQLSLSTLKMVKSFGKFLNVSTSIGGAYIPKVSAVDHVLICTPRNLCDMIRNKSLCKDFIKIFVIDDADEMLKIKGFFNEMRQILLFLNNDPQLIITSSSKFEEILDFFSCTMSNPEYIIMSDERPSLDSILQYYICLSEEWKFDAICELYDVLNLMHTVVYCNTWSKSLKVVKQMCAKTYSVLAVNNEMDTNQRRVILQQFRSGSCRMLVTTELLRGEDFTDAMWVINYDLPKNPKDYVRRIMSCFDHTVKVINFIGPNDMTIKKNIEIVFNVEMLNFPQNVTNLNLSNLNSSNNPLVY